MTELAVVDRFEEDQAVLLVGDDERLLVVDRTSLPLGTKEGHWLRVSFDGGRLVAAEIDEAATEAARLRIADKLARLRRNQRK